MLTWLGSKQSMRTCFEAHARSSALSTCSLTQPLTYTECSVAWAALGQEKAPLCSLWIACQEGRAAQPQHWL